MLGTVIRVAAAITALLAVGTASAAPASAEGEAVASAAAGAAVVAAEAYTTFCSLREDDWTSDCLSVTKGVTRGRVVPGSISYEWRFVPTGAANTYTLRDRGSDNCLDTFGNAVDSPVVIDSCSTAKASQRWVVETTLSTGPFGLFHPLRNQASGLYMTFETLPVDPVTGLSSPVVQRALGLRPTQFFARLGPAV
jgi:hypothetical protein